MTATPHQAHGTGKAGTLLLLQAAGYCVPEFTVLTLTTDDHADSSVESSGILADSAELSDIADRIGFPLAARSSASVEDGAAASFAGQFSSYLNITSLEELRLSVLKCRDSMCTPGVIDYCRRTGFADQSIRMQIIIQRMIQPELAGVAFTLNPVTGTEEVVIEACSGPGNELLAGRESALPELHPLLNKHRDQITTVACSIQQLFGCPQDIEFAIEDDVLYILQARPITRIGTTAIDGEWTNANFRDGGVSSSVCSPLMWSLYERIWNCSLKQTLREIKLPVDNFEAARLFFGRPYWNLGALKRCLTEIPGFVEREFDTDIGIEIRYQGDGIRTPISPWNVIKVLPVVLAIRRYLHRQKRETSGYLNGGFEKIEARYEQLPDDTAEIDRQFRRMLDEHYFRFECTYFRTIFSLSLAKLEFKLCFPEADYSLLMMDLPAVKHSAPVRRMRELGDAGEPDVAKLLHEFRHHYHVGLDIRHPRWDEDPEYVQSLLQQLHDQIPATSRSSYKQIRAETAARLPYWKRTLFNRKLDQLRHLVWLREEMRDLSNRMYYMIRRWVQEIARRRCLGDDIYFMTSQQIFDDDRSCIDRAKVVFESYRNYQAPNEIGVRTAFGAPPESTGQQAVLRGLAASPGMIRTTAYLAHSSKAAMLIPPGSILITRFTDPGWTPALSRVGGVVTETGGILSHAAVICREFNIPAVLGVPHACEYISNGSVVLVDGAQGRVQIADNGSGVNQLNSAML